MQATHIQEKPRFLLKCYPWARVEASVLMFAIVGGMGIVVWLFWCRSCFQDPLFVIHTPCVRPGADERRHPAHGAHAR